MSAVAATDLFRLYSSPEGTAVALQGLTLEVAEGEVVVVLGPSGSGKSTLVRILAGLDRPSAGRAIVLGSDLAGLSSRAMSRYRSEQTGYADQHYSRALAPELTAREIVGLRLGLEGAPRAERGRRADELLERVGLSDKRDARPYAAPTRRARQSLPEVCPRSASVRFTLRRCVRPSGPPDQNLRIRPGSARNRRGPAG